MGCAMRPWGKERRGKARRQGQGKEGNVDPWYTLEDPILF